MQTFLTAVAIVLIFPAAHVHAAALQQIQSIGLEGVHGRIDHLAADLQSGRLYVAALGNNTVEVLDLKAGKRLQSLTEFQEPQGICVIPDTGKVVIASGKDGKVRIYDRVLKLLGAVDGLDDADNVRYDSSTKLVYVGYGDGALAIIDPEKAARLADIHLDGHPESFQLDTNSPRIFINVPTARQIAVVDREKRTVIAKWPLSDVATNFPMALDPANHRLFIGCRTPARLLVLDTSSGKAVTSMDCCGDVDDLFYDAARKRVYASGGVGCISVFEQSDPDHYRLIDTIPTAPGARTCLFLPQTDELLLAIPHRGPQQAEIRLFTARQDRPQL